MKNLFVLSISYFVSTLSYGQILTADLVSSDTVFSSNPYIKVKFVTSGCFNERNNYMSVVFGGWVTDNLIIEKGVVMENKEGVYSPSKDNTESFKIKTSALISGKRYEMSFRMTENGCLGSNNTVANLRYNGMVANILFIYDMPLGIEEYLNDNSSVVSIEYFNLNGQIIIDPHNYYGLMIVKKTFSNSEIKVSKELHL